MAKVCLIVIDGWGVTNELEGNAIANAATPVMDGLARSEGQYITLDASGLAVGLPDGLMGNSEVGHLNIGAGRVIYQDIVRINLDVKSKVSYSSGQWPLRSRTLKTVGTNARKFAGNPFQRNIQERLQSRQRDVGRPSSSAWTRQRWRSSRTH